ncbi:hypothetical protein LLH23_13940 [bacterium]|nr:hypothetical protein [bacterium]
MSALRERIAAARSTLARLTHEVCGACRQNCCHQGTMMGSQGLRRVYKGLLMDPDFGGRLREGLRLRREEIAADLQVAGKVAQLLSEANLADEDRARLPELQQRLTDLHMFVQYMGGDFPLTCEGMSRLLLYSAVRSNLLRCMRQFPGGEAALTTLSQGRASFRFRGRKMAPPRCIFHHEACLAEDWKPVKCANFFCASEPNLLARARDEMSFDDFVLANVRPCSTDYVRRLLRLENDLGPEYWEPKIIIGPEDLAELFQEEIVGLLRSRRQVQVRRDSGRFMYATNEILATIESLPEQQNLIHTCQGIDGAALYELAAALERARGAEWHGGLVLLARELIEHSFMPHPLWQDEMISQPLGGLEIYLV